MGHAGAAPADDPAHRRLAAGRVTAAFWTIHYSLAPLGAAGLTAAAGRFGVPTVCLAVGTGCVLVALTAVLTPIRLARPEALAIQPA